MAEWLSQFNSSRAQIFAAPAPAATPAAEEITVTIGPEENGTAVEQRKSIILPPDPGQLVSDEPPPPILAPPPAVAAGALRVCTLNIGGRNTNSFEFLMAGDGSALAKQWHSKYDRAMRAVDERGPADHPGLAEAVAAVQAQPVSYTHLTLPTKA